MVPPALIFKRIDEKRISFASCIFIKMKSKASCLSLLFIHLPSEPLWVEWGTLVAYTTIEVEYYYTDYYILNWLAGDPGGSNLVIKKARVFIQIKSGLHFYQSCFYDLNHLKCKIQVKRTEMTYNYHLIYFHFFTGSGRFYIAISHVNKNTVRSSNIG